jgi:hypothetical protein
MLPNKIEEMAVDTLYFRRLNKDASSLQINVAGRDLEQQSIVAIPIIERTIRDIVNHTIRDTEDHPFHGLPDLLGVYLKLCMKHDRKRSVDFLRTLSPTLQAEAVALVPVYFRKQVCRDREKETNDRKMPPSIELMNYVREMTQSTHQMLRENAKWAASFYFPVLSENALSENSVAAFGQGIPMDRSGSADPDLSSEKYEDSR